MSPATAAKLSLLGHCEGEVEFLLREKRILSAKLEKIETALIGAKERLRQVKEEVRVATSQEVREEVFSREVEIARMKGVTISLGEELTSDIKAMLRRPIGG